MEFTLLTEEQRRMFEEDGLLIVRGALDPDTVARLIEAGDRLCATDRTENRYRTDDGQYDGFRNCIAMDDAFLPLLTNAGTVPLLVQLLGPNIHLITSHLIHKSPNPADTPRTRRVPGWHRDVAGTVQDLGHAHIPRLEVKCAYYLSDLTAPDSGATLFSPGSHLLKQRLRIPEGRPDPENVLELRLAPGDAVFFENRTWHAGAVNLTGRTTRAVMFGYGHLWLKPFDYAVQPPALIEKIGSDEIAGQLLGSVQDPEGRFVPGGINRPLRDWCARHGVDWRAPTWGGPPSDGGWPPLSR
jgi:ectoine hydroxylase-related dioxygenase (phytanoyl-CoA dioxygenase family)